MPVDLETLRPIVDRPDFEEALRHDDDGHFRSTVEAYLSEWSAIVSGELGKGLPPEDYQAMSLLGESIETASKVTEFFAVLKEQENGGGSAPAS